MERISWLLNVQRYLRSTPSQQSKHEDTTSSHQHQQYHHHHHHHQDDDQNHQIINDDDDEVVIVDKDDAVASCRLFHVLESILLWENSVNSISVIVVFNILFWSIVILEIRGFAAASSAALVVVLCYNTLEAQVPKEKAPGTNASQARAMHIEKIAKKTKSALESLKQMRQEQPGAFCSMVCTVSIGLWLLGRTINGVLLAYIMFMSILLGPILVLQMSSRTFSSKEWDNEIEEFLPAVTADNLQVLKRAGDARDHSPTPPSMDSDSPYELKMPSHKEENVDDLLQGLVEELNDIKFHKWHFESGSSSDEEAKLKKIASISEDNDSDNETSDSDFDLDEYEVITTGSITANRTSDQPVWDGE